MDFMRVIRGGKQSRLLAHAVAGCLAMFAASAHAGYVFTTIDYPGATFTDVRGINNAGQIVGYTDLGGFLYSAGTFTPLPAAPGGLVVGAHGINDGGTIIGAAGPADDSYAVGFLLNGSTYTFFSYPSRTYTFPRSINAAGVVTGYAEDRDATGNSINNLGFIYDPATGVFTDVTVPGATLVIAQGINTAGQVVGSVRGGTFSNNAFLRDPATGALSYFKIDGKSTRARGINNAGLITGFQYDWTSNVTSAFVGSSAGYELLHVSASDDTIGEAINDSGQISGLFFDRTSGGPAHGFIATPAALPTGTTSGGAYTFSVDVVADIAVFIDPPPALGYDYETGIGDPEFTTVRLPIGIGDSRYVLIVNKREFPLAGGELFDFRTHGYAAGVSSFRVADIETSAGLDPNNPQAFPTQLAFSRAGRFTGTMTPLCLKHDLPPQASAQARRSLLRPCL